MKRYYFIFLAILMLSSIVFADFQSIISDTVKSVYYKKVSRSSTILPHDSVLWDIVLDKKIDYTKFEKIESDDKGWFKGRELRGVYLFYSVPQAKNGFYLVEARGIDMFYYNGDAYIGNRYMWKDEFEPWEPDFSYSFTPVNIIDNNKLFVFKSNRGNAKIIFHRIDEGVYINPKGSTLPDILIGEKVNHFAGINIINATDEVKNNLQLKVFNKELNVNFMNKLSTIESSTVRKFPIVLKGDKVADKVGKYIFKLYLLYNNTVLDSSEIIINVKDSSSVYKRTFLSNIDSSVQYYTINPPLVRDNDKKALFLSVHGADVESFNQASSYSSKSWAYIVSPTNRGPYGFDWEDWGRIDAMEVYNIALDSLNIDRDRVYLTGHSMGGHGTWYLGSIYPDRFAVIAPSAGWITFWSYLPQFYKKEFESPFEIYFRRAFNVDNTFAFIKNYENLGIYIIHGIDDKVVPIEQSYTMVDSLKNFHKDFRYHWEPGAGHWWDNDEKFPGTACVDWPPLFDFAARHVRYNNKNIKHIRFTTVNPEISNSYYWINVYSQINPLEISKIDINFKEGLNLFEATTKNIKVFSIDLSCFAKKEDFISVFVDSIAIDSIPWPKDDTLWLGFSGNKWNVINRPSLFDKGPHRYGAFKEAFKHNFVLVYGTSGNEMENKWAKNKAIFDAQYFWYQGNGSPTVISDKEFLKGNFAGRNIILYGNKNTNLAYKHLISEKSPIQIENNRLIIKKKKIKRDDIGGMFIYPLEETDNNLVAVIGGTGIAGMRSFYGIPYLHPGFGMPDFIFITPEIYKSNGKGKIAIGFFDNKWKVSKGNFYLVN